jgi:hypothetical protein
MLTALLLFLGFLPADHPIGPCLPAARASQAAFAPPSDEEQEQPGWVHAEAADNEEEEEEFDDHELAYHLLDKGDDTGLFILRLGSTGSPHLPVLHDLHCSPRSPPNHDLLP